MTLEGSRFQSGFGHHLRNRSLHLCRQNSTPVVNLVGVVNTAYNFATNQITATALIRE